MKFTVYFAKKWRKSCVVFTYSAFSINFLKYIYRYCFLKLLLIKIITYAAIDYQGASPNPYITLIGR